VLCVFFLHCYMAWFRTLPETRKPTYICPPRTCECLFDDIPPHALKEAEADVRDRRLEPQACACNCEEETVGTATNTRVHGSHFYYISAYLRAYADMLLKRQADTSARHTAAKQSDHTQPIWDPALWLLLANA
jgi:hypothetical protein